MRSMTVVTGALEQGLIYALVALALFLSYRVLNIADMTTDGSFTLGCAVSATVALAGHPFLALPAAMTTHPSFMVLPPPLFYSVYPGSTGPVNFFNFLCLKRRK